MAKRSFKVGTLMAPLPAVMVSCGDMDKSNIIAIAWTGIVNSNPPRTYISVKPERFSYDMIKNSGEFVINLVPKNLSRAMDYAGCVSGRKEDKFAKLKLTKEKADFVSCPMIAESPVNLECKVFDIKNLGSHDMFLADIVAVHVDEKYINQNDKILFEKMKLVSLVHGEYLANDLYAGKMGFSVKKK